MRHIRILILSLAATLLPVHTMAAMAMSVTAKMSCCTEMNATNDQASARVNCLHVNDEQTPSSDSSCNYCGDCHLASSMMVPPTIVSDDALPGPGEHGVSPAPTELSFITKPLPRPPRLC
ncbi:MAG: hypothetical protein IPO13_14425 [Rhodocyclaceae bacterium]|nr:hypothetical protein [Rhodocyclaceae bacterium]